MTRITDEKFHKEFPSLKNMEYETNDIVGEVFSKGNITQFCLDKQRVHDVIDKAIMKSPCMVGFSLKQIEEALKGKQYRFEVRNELRKHMMAVDLAKYHDKIETELGLEE